MSYFSVGNIYYTNTVMVGGILYYTSWTVESVRVVSAWVIATIRESSQITGSYFLHGPHGSD